jgi:hypothetical protein
MRELSSAIGLSFVLALGCARGQDLKAADSALDFKANDKLVLSRRVLGGYEISLAGRNASVNATRMK